jgi:hypothetical protein
VKRAMGTLRTRYGHTTGIGLRGHRVTGALRAGRDPTGQFRRSSRDPFFKRGPDRTTVKHR